MKVTVIFVSKHGQKKYAVNCKGELYRTINKGIKFVKCGFYSQGRYDLARLPIDLQEKLENKNDRKTYVSCEYLINLFDATNTVDIDCSKDMFVPEVGKYFDSREAVIQYMADINWSGLYNVYEHVVAVKV